MCSARARGEAPIMFEPDLRSDPVRVVVAGGGVAALETLVAPHARLCRTRLDIVLVAPGDDFVYRPLQVGEPFGLGAARHYALSTVCRERGAEFVRDSVSSVDTDARTVTLGRGELLGYDILILAVGANAYPAFEHGATFDREQAPDDFDEVLSATAWRARPASRDRRSRQARPGPCRRMSWRC